LTTTRRYAFGPFILDRVRGVLQEQGRTVDISPRAFELLAAFVERPGELLSKEHLLTVVWRDSLVEEHNLTRQVSFLRKALRERPGQRDYIVTVPGMGYRFAAQVTEVAETAHMPPAIDAVVASRPRFRWGWTAIAAASLGILSIGLGAALVWQHWASPGDLGVRAVRQVTFGPGLQMNPAWSPDGRRLAFASDQLGNSDIWVQRLDGSEPSRITTSPARDWQPAWSPDGTRIVYRSEENGGGLYVVPIAGGEARRIAEFGAAPQWSPAGDLILFSNANVRNGARKLYVIAPDGGTPREVAAAVIEPLIASMWYSAIEAAWHPDGARISVWGTQPNGQPQFVTVPVAGGAPVYSQIPDDLVSQLEAQQLQLHRFVWAPSGTFLYFEGESADTRSVWRVAVDASTLRWKRAPQRLTADASDEGDITLSPDGRRLAFTVRAEQTRVWSLDFNPQLGRLTGHMQPLTAGHPGRVDVDTARDGSRLAYRSMQAGRSELRELRTADREERVLFVSQLWSPTSPRWSSDGRRLAYARRGIPDAPGREPRGEVAVLAPDRNEEQLLPVPEALQFRPSDWANDGETILGDCRPTSDQTTGICVIPTSSADAAGDAARVLLHRPGSNLYGPRFSPDERWISFVAVDAKGSRTSRLYVAPASGGAWIPITDGTAFDDKARWAPDGRTIFFVSDRGGYLNLRGRRFDPAAGRAVGEPFAVTSFGSGGTGLPSNPTLSEFAVTERQIFLPIAESSRTVWVLDDIDR
jgi:Tol biopolymer transport system component/DNA-binding winged helix-turn-helix (wHTH) protein